MQWTYSVYVDTNKMDSIIAQLADPQAGLNEIAEQTVATIKENIIREKVIDTGALLNSITWEPRLGGNGVIVRDGVEYGIFNEFGTYRLPARPFFVPALEKIGELFSAIFWKYIK